MTTKWLQNLHDDEMSFTSMSHHQRADPWKDPVVKLKGTRLWGNAGFKSRHTEFRSNLTPRIKPLFKPHRS